MVTIKSNNISKAVFAPELGAICSSLVFNNRELLFRHDFFWDKNSKKTRGGIPFLFPICGRLFRNQSANTYLYNEKMYQMPVHGFADKLSWNVLPQNIDSEISFALTSTNETFELYPFNFNIVLTYKITDDALTAIAEFENTGDNPMPFYAGFHPYFLTPLSEKNDVLFNANPDYSIKYNESFTDIVGEIPSPKLPAKLTALSLKDLLMRVKKQKDAQIIFPDNFVVNISTSGSEIDFPYIQLYTMENQPFFCVEPWMGAPNTLNSVSGVKWLSPGKKETAKMKICVSSEMQN